jgi:hypothetical protein
MGTTAPQIPVKSWQFFTSCRRLLGDSFLQKLFKVSLRQIQRWAADPAFAEDTDRNPADRIEVILSRLMEIGRGDVARAMVSRLAIAVDCELQCLDEMAPDGKSLIEELLDDHMPLAQFHEAVRNGEPPVTVHRLYQAAKDELTQSYVMYAKSWKKDRQ